MRRERRTVHFRSLLQRYADLQRTSNPDWASDLRRLRQIQVETFRNEHAKALPSKDHEQLFNFYVDNLHSGVELDGALKENQRVLAIVSHLDETFNLLVCAMNYSIRAQELDDEVIAVLRRSRSGQDTQRVLADQLDARLEHVETLRPLGRGLAPYAKRRFAGTAFKFAMAPLLATGLSPMVKPMLRGFDALMKLDNVQDTFDRVVDVNLIATRRLCSKDAG